MIVFVPGDRVWVPVQGEDDAPGEVLSFRRGPCRVRLDDGRTVEAQHDLLRPIEDGPAADEPADEPG